MRTDLTPALSSFLAGATRAYICDLYTITLASGETLRYTNSDRAIVWEGNTYTMGPGIDRTRVRVAIGLQTEEMRITVRPRSTDTINPSYPVALRQALVRGDFDGAQVWLSRGYAPTPADALVGVVPTVFYGRVSTVLSIDGGSYELVCATPLELLDSPYPRNVFQPMCQNVLFDAACQKIPAAYLATGSVTGSISATRMSFGTADAHAAGWFTGGRLRFVTGANAGLSQPVRNFGAGIFEFVSPWPNPIVVTDSYDAWPGCDKTMATCSTKFSNLARFRGQPFIPAPETTT